MSTSKIVHVIDDDPALLDSLRFVLESARLHVKTYASARDFINALPEVGDGCVITDVKMHGISGIELVRELKSMLVELPIIVMTAHADVAVAVEAMKAGAIDFIEKPFDDVDLLKSIELAFESNSKNLEKGQNRAAIRERVASLSPRERQVLTGLIGGQPNKIIAADLKISPRTVEIYRAHVMTKMNASSLPDLVRLGLIVGLVPED